MARWVALLATWAALSAGAWAQEAVPNVPQTPAVAPATGSVAGSAAAAVVSDVPLREPEPRRLSLEPTQRREELLLAARVQSLQNWSLALKISTVPVALFGLLALGSGIQYQSGYLDGAGIATLVASGVLMTAAILLDARVEAVVRAATPTAP